MLLHFSWHRHSGFWKLKQFGLTLSRLVTLCAYSFRAWFNPRFCANYYNDAWPLWCYTIRTEQQIHDYIEKYHCFPVNFKLFKNVSLTWFFCSSQDFFFLHRSEILWREIWKVTPLYFFFPAKKTLSRTGRKNIFFLSTRPISKSCLVRPRPRSF